MEKGVRRRVQEDVKFGKYIKALREKCGYSMRQLCEGLCTFQEIACLESGKHRPEKLLQDAVLERLGVGSEDREHFLGYVAYDRWKIRQRIFHAITFEQTQRAEELLEEYARVYCSGQASTTGMRGMVERLERQFYLGMKAQVRRCQGSSREELGELFQEAVELTVPESEQKSLDELVLSIRELNLMLEAEYGRGEGERPERYLEALDYLEKRHFDRVGRGKVYPKAVYFLCRCILDRKASSDGLFQEEWDEARLLKYCDKALDILRDIRRMYYFWEILVIREKLLEEEAYCINDLVALRRRMLGISRFEEMYQPLIEEGLQEAVSGMYEHVMGFIGSEWGDKGEYDRADMYSGIIMQGCLRFRRNAFLHKSLYDRWWNYSKRIEEVISTGFYIVILVFAMTRKVQILTFILNSHIICNT